MAKAPWRLRALSPAVRVGLTCMVLAALGGLAASGRHVTAATGATNTAVQR